MKCPNFFFKNVKHLVESLTKMVYNFLACLEHAKHSTDFYGDQVIIVEIVIVYTWYWVYIITQ